MDWNDIRHVADNKAFGRKEELLKDIQGNLRPVVETHLNSFVTDILDYVKRQMDDAVFKPKVEKIEAELREEVMHTFYEVNKIFFSDESEVILTKVKTFRDLGDAQVHALKMREKVGNLDEMDYGIRVVELL